MRNRPLCLFAVVFLIFQFAYAKGIWPGGGMPGHWQTIDNVLCDEGDACVTGRIYHKEIKNEQCIYYLKNATLQVEGVTNKQGNSQSVKPCILKNTRLLVQLDTDEFPYRSTITLTGKVKTFSPARNEGNFSEKDYYNSLGLICRIKKCQISSTSQGFLTYDWLYRFRKNIVEIYENNLPGEESGIMSAIALGDKSTLESDAKDLFAGAGLAHLLAISGLHISLVGSGVYKILRRIGCRLSVSAIVSAGFVISYCLMTGASLSAVRASGMFLFFMVAEIFGEAYDQATGLAVMALILVIINNGYIVNSGFIFSFAAVMGIIIFAQPAQERFETTWSKKLISTLAITLWTMPVVAYYYYELPTFGVFLNILLLPLMSWLLIFGLAGGIIGIAFPLLGAIILKPCHYLIFLYEMTADYSLKLPFSKLIIGRPSVIRIFFYFLFLLLSVRLLYSKNPMRNRLMTLATMLASTAILLWPSAGSFSVNFLDVGQGDGVYVSSDEGISFFIDGGSTSIKEVGKYRIIPFLKSRGVRQVDYWFVSHPDEDHCNGLIEVLESGFTVKCVVVSEHIIKNDDYEKLVDAASMAGSQLVYMSEGGKCGTKTLNFTCIYPDEGSLPDDTNARSLCLKMTYDRENDGISDFSALFVGDIGEEQEKQMVEKDIDLRTDLLKVAHHGSRYSSCDAFLKKVQASYSVISCDRINSYGHPSPFAVERLENACDNIFYTMDSGQVTFMIDKNCQVIIRSFIKKAR